MSWSTTSKSTSLLSVSTHTYTHKIGAKDISAVPTSAPAWVQAQRLAFCVCNLHPGTLQDSKWCLSFRTWEGPLRRGVVASDLQGTLRPWGPTSVTLPFFQALFVAEEDILRGCKLMYWAENPTVPFSGFLGLLGTEGLAAPRAWSV